tara:strand:+ start:890 stop:1585 length:696 start_codon:yes stop_codon:yes gene_type:complete
MTTKHDEKGEDVDDADVPDNVPIVLNINETNNDDEIDLMDGDGLKAPEPVEPAEIFKEDAVEPVAQVEAQEETVYQQKVKFNKNGKPRKAMTEDRLMKLALARKKALETRQRNKLERDKTKNIININTIPTETPPSPPPTPKVSVTAIPKVSREQKKKELQEAVAEGVRIALEKNNIDRKERKAIKKKKQEEETELIKEKNQKEEKDKMVATQLNKLNDIDGFYNDCFNFN